MIYIPDLGGDHPGPGESLPSGDSEAARLFDALREWFRRAECAGYVVSREEIA